ncbi:MAG: glycosyltransferase [Fibrobacter sp.]|jgi:UDP:flavonoid glycosyltransferase YjiC (YdhE family)|nr:glycosyltransferase [Fibrobacter sp.]
MSKKILFFPDVYQEQGHWLPAVSLAEALKNRGHEVAFMGIADCKAIVEPYSFPFHEIFKKEYPFGYTKTHQHRSVSERWKPVHLWNIMNGGLDELMSRVNPDLIISGYFASLETLLIRYKYNKPFLITTTYLRHPDDDPGIRGIQNLVGMSDAMSRRVMESVYSGDIPSDELTVYQFVKPLETAMELVPCPREFEFSNYLFDSDLHPETSRVKFIEPCVTRPITESDTQVGWTEGIPADKLSGNRILFATAGSQVHDYKDKARRWFQEMILMMDLQGMQNYHLVISAGSELIKEHWKLPSNVSVFSWVPQLSVLDKCAAAYIHGGLATVKECIYKGVPFVILPLGKDQMDNALRVRRAGIGEVSFAESVSCTDLQSLFLQATTNTWTKARLNKMKATFEEMETARPGVQLIHDFAENL